MTVKGNFETVDFNKDYVINYGKKDEVLVACGVVGSIDDFVVAFKKAYPAIEIETIEEKPRGYVSLYDRLRAKETKRLLQDEERLLSQAAEAE